ncbi:MAG: acyl-CoA dehydrogenase family protein [Pseudomonadota bacterium]|nr:acyl-CoA dehydrogenase family protein [Pseudomonadota bacterium]
MNVDIKAVDAQVRREDRESWQLMQTLLHELGGLVMQADQEADIPASLWSRVPVGPLNRFNMPQAHGGVSSTGSAVHRCILFEQLGRVCPGLAIALPGPGLSMPPVFALGTPEQQRVYFERFHDEHRPVWGVFAITEPGIGSDATALRLHARRDGDDYVLNGEKCFITNGMRADVIVVFATLDASKGRFGIRAFVVDKNAKGFSADRCEDMMGLRASQLTSLSFQDCRVPAGAMLGHNGKRGPLIDAFTGAQYAWDYMRPALSSLINGACAGALALARQIAAHDDGGLSAQARQAVQADLDTYQARLESARLLTLRAAWRYDQELRVSLDASMAKAFTSTLSMELAQYLSQRFALAAPAVRQRFDKFYRDAKAFDILEGTGDMQRQMIARAFDPTAY